MTAPVYQDRPPEQMTYEEYLAEQAAIVAALVAVVTVIALPYQAIALTYRTWLGLLAALYPYVEDARRQSSDLARRFYDSERHQFVDPVRLRASESELLDQFGRPILLDDTTNITRLVYEHFPIDLEGYDPNHFEEAMGAVVDIFSRRNASDNDLALVGAQAAKQAENAGRQTLMRAVANDPEPIGWARVEGTENIGSCGFCAMLISRGPVYKESPANAGLQADSETLAVEIFRRAEDSGSDAELMSLMNRWHENCDCKVVPVFDRKNWNGREEYERLENLWGDVTKGLSGKDALNAFRRAIEGGQTGEERTLRVVA